MLGMRRTMWVVGAALAPVVHASSSLAVAAKERRRLTGLLAGAGIPDPSAWLADVGAATVAALSARGEATAGELTGDVPELSRRVLMAPGKSYAAEVTLTSRIMLLLGADGLIVRGRPRGSWSSSQHRWTTLERWLPGGLAGWTPEGARIELARRWLASFGPAAVADLSWWTGWTGRDVSQALASLDTVEVDLDGRPGVVLADDVEPPPPPGSWAALLPALDPTPMGWSSRDWYLGAHRNALFDRSGNVGPTVWWCGRIVGGWAHRHDGEVAYRLLEDIGSAGQRAVEEAADRVAAVTQPVIVTPRFRTPLERELSA
jgi:hypothetical protein